MRSSHSTDRGLQAVVDDIRSRFCAFAGLLAISGAALADFTPEIGDFSTVPEPGILELLAPAAVVGWVVRKRGRK